MKTGLINVILMLALIGSGVGAAPAENDQLDKASGQVPTMTESEIWARQALEGMSTEEKIGQMFITGIEKEFLNSKEIDMIEDGQVGGLIFLGHNIRSEQEFRSLLKALPESPLPMFLSVDQEGGRVERLPSKKDAFMSAYSLGQSPEKAYIHGQGLGRSVNDYGLNLNFAPVMDIFSNEKNKVIGTRAFGKDPDLVARVGLDVMQGIKSQGVIPCVKHFPGHGDTVVDSHEGLPKVDHGLDRLMSFEWVPFKAAIDGQVPMIMAGHILVSEIDGDYPASLSEKLIEGHLRGTLGYDGLVITDDLIMGAISENFTDEFVARQAVKAGVDILLVSDNDRVFNMTQSIAKALEEEEIFESQIDDSLMRILKIKHEYLVQDQDPS